MSAFEWTEQCEQIAQYVANDYFFPGASRDDVLQEARIGIWKALRDYRPGAGSTFASFATLCARRQALTGLKMAQAQKHEVLSRAASMDAPAGGDAPAEVRLGDLLFRSTDDPCRIVIAREAALEMLAKMRLLSSWERECVERVRMAGEDYMTVGGGTAAGRKRVDNALQRVEKKLLSSAPPAPERRRTKVYVDRTVHPSERQAVAAALRVVNGEVLGVSKRKLLDGHERAPQGRPDRQGRRGQPVWRVDLLAA